MAKDKDEVKKITFFTKNTIHCPVCGGDFYKEELYRGGGRLLAGKLTEELRRLYEPSKKYGEINPLIYVIIVCPYCNYAAFPADFPHAEKKADKLKADTEKRKSALLKIFDDIDFTKPRDLKEGVASYFFATMCYDHFDKRFGPTIKQGICSLRCAWLFNDFHKKMPNENYDYLAKIFYRKARFFYSMALEREQRGEETLGAVSHLGPDMDKNYGYEGVLYIGGLLEYNYGNKQDPEKRAESLGKLRRVIGKAHGLGKASKAKPSAILEKAKDLFDKIGKELDSMKKD
ncbi:MAG: DUF2225 domain-containing protein [Spirochaetales bacterium]|nr:DUF2225 domain-containing protein [Spirochaetales bacterium]